jgi:gliding motility-associated-like protein
LAQPGGIDGPPWIIELLDPITTATLMSDPNVITTTTFSGLSAGDYILRSIDTTGCYADTLINIPEPPQMTMVVSNDTIICIGGTAVLSATGSGGTTPYTYDWVGLTGNGPHSVSPAISNYFIVNVVDDLGCTSALDSVLVAVNPPILITPSLDDTVCPGGTGSLSVLVNGGQGGTYNYVWTDASGVQVGNASVLDVMPLVGPSTYYISVTDNCETPAATDSLVIHWYQEPQVNFLTTDNTGCYPVEVTFTNATPTNQVLSCLWNFGDGSSSATCGTLTHLYNTPGDYTVNLTITSPEGCINDTTMVDVVEVYDYPIAQFEADPNPVDILNPIVHFHDLSSSDVVGFEWSFFAGATLLSTSSQQNPIYEFPDNDPANYNVHLLVVNADGCQDTISVQVIVNGVFTCYVPTAFTPDGDGLNDFFYVKGESIDVTNFNFRVYNRWGEKVFEAEDINSMWDGRHKNAPAQEDIYIWKVETKDAVTGELKEFTGHVNLMR